MERKMRSVLLGLLLLSLTLALTGCIPGLFGPKDTDKDGIPDKWDQCPTQPGLPQYGGCPPPAPTMDLTGTWQGELVDANNRRFELRMSLQQSGSVLAGTVWLTGWSHTVQSGSVNTKTGSVVFQFTYQGTGTTFVLRGSVQGDIMSGRIEDITVQPGVYFGSWEVSRA